MTTAAELNSPHFPNWCAGCGNFGIWASFKSAAVKAGWDNTNTAFIAGIGCHGHIVNFVKLTAFEGLHGRALPVASGLKYSNSNLNVFVFTGDGDCFGEGGNHFIHTCRRNHNITVLLHNNDIYGLTTGQTSPTTSQGFKSKSTPEGNFNIPITPLALAITSGATFVARCYSNDIAFQTELMIKANQHKGTSVVEILQPCITYNHECTPSFFLDNIYQLGPDYDPSNKFAALEKSFEWGPKQIPVGILYQVDKPIAEDEFKDVGNLVDQEATKRDISKYFQKLY